MGQAYDFLSSLHQRFESLRNLLRNFVREEELFKEDILVRSGFLLRRYSLRIDRVNLESIAKLKAEFQEIVKIQADINYRYKQFKGYLQEIERDYRAYKRQKLHIDRIFTQYLNDTFYLSKVIIGKLDELSRHLEAGIKIHAKTIGKEVEITLESIEKIANRILRFMDLLEQLEVKVNEFEAVSYYPSEKMYGRAMAKKEAKHTVARGELIGSPKRKEGDLIGVFDCTPAVVKKIESMPQDQLKTFFGQIGVVGGIKVIYIRTRLKPIAGPIPQSNGLIEYKFPKRTHVRIAA